MVAHGIVKFHEKTQRSRSDSTMKSKTDLVDLISLYMYSSEFFPQALPSVPK